MLHLARRHNIPTVLLPFAVSTQESDAYLRRTATNLRLDRGPFAFARRVFARRNPKHVFESEYGPMLFYSLWESLALAKHGLHQTSPWVFGGGEIDAMAVASTEDLETARSCGLAEGQIRVTGQASLDTLYASRLNRDANADLLRRKYGLNGHYPTIVCAVPHSAEHQLRSWEQHAEDTKALFQVLSRCQANVLLSLHPKSNSSFYRQFGDLSDLHFVDEPLREILSVADIFVAGYSSTVRWSATLGIPTVISDLPSIGYKMYDHLTNIPKLTNVEDLTDALTSLANDPVKRESIGQALQSEASNTALIDGNACKRIIDLFAELSCCSKPHSIATPT